MRDKFNQAAGAWDEKPERVKASLALAEKLKSVLSFSPDSVVLDYGCGTGNVSLSIASDVNHLYACDFSSGMLEVVEKKAGELQTSNIETVLVDDGFGNHFADNSIDIIFSTMVFHHVEDLDSVMSCFASFLKKGGMLAIVDLVEEDGSFHSDNDGVAHFGFSEERISELFKKHGFLSDSYSVIHSIDKGASGSFPVFLMRGKKA